MKLLAVGTDKKSLKSWSVCVETDELDLDSIAAELYKDEKSNHEIPSSISLIKVSEGLPVLHSAYRFIDDEWEDLEVEPGVYPRPTKDAEVVAEIETPKV